MSNPMQLQSTTGNPIQNNLHPFVPRGTPQTFSNLLNGADEYWQKETNRMQSATRNPIQNSSQAYNFHFFANRTPVNGVEEDWQQEQNRMQSATRNPIQNNSQVHNRLETSPSFAEFLESCAQREGSKSDILSSHRTFNKVNDLFHAPEQIKKRPREIEIVEIENAPDKSRRTSSKDKLKRNLNSNIAQEPHHPATQHTQLTFHPYMHPATTRPQPTFHPDMVGQQKPSITPTNVREDLTANCPREFKGTTQNILVQAPVQAPVQILPYISPSLNNLLCSIQTLARYESSKTYKFAMLALYVSAYCENCKLTILDLREIFNYNKDDNIKRHLKNLNDLGDVVEYSVEYRNKSDRIDKGDVFMAIKWDCMFRLFEENCHTNLLPKVALDNKQRLIAQGSFTVVA